MGNKIKKSLKLFSLQITESIQNVNDCMNTIIGNLRARWPIDYFQEFTHIVGHKSELNGTAYIKIFPKIRWVKKNKKQIINLMQTFGLKIV